MTAREYLQQARGMKLRLEALEERRAFYRDMASGRIARYKPGTGGGTRRVSSVEKYACKLADLEADMARRVGAYVELVAEIEVVIDAVPDQRYRDLLRFRYLNGWSWHKIARRMGYQVESMYKMHDNALRFVRVPDKSTSKY